MPEAALATPPAAPAANPGPKTFDRGTPSSAPSLRDTLKSHAAPDPNEPPPKPPKPTPPHQPPELPEKPEKKEPEVPEQPEKTAAGKEVPRGTKEPEKPKAKVNPWNELKSERARASTLEAEVTRLKSSIVPEQERTALTTRMESIQRENEELRNRIRFKDYEHSPDFQDNFHKPYVKALDSAMADLKSIPVVDSQGQPARAATQADLMEIAQILHNDLPAARRRAKELFGDDSGVVEDVIGMAKEVRRTLIARNEALKAEETNGATREQQNREKTQREEQAIVKAAMTLWQQDDTETLTKDPDIASFVRPIEPKEGQQLTPEETEHNESVKKGYELVDQWWHKKAKDCKTNEEFKELVRHHAAIRRRAAGFGPLRRMFNRQKKELAQLKSELGAYQDTTPPAGGRIANGVGGKGTQQETGLKKGWLAKYAGRK